MGEISRQQIYDLALEVQRSVGRLESKVGEALIEARLLNREIEMTNQLLSESLRQPPKASVS